jgi:hypothetical protein
MASVGKNMWQNLQKKWNLGDLVLNHDKALTHSALPVQEFLAKTKV